MAGEILEGAASMSPADAASEMAETGPDASHESGRERGHGGVAVLLTAAAIVAAAIGFRAAVISSSASDSWQSALRTEVKRSAAVIEDVRYLYQAELPMAVRIAQARIVGAEMRAAAQGQGGTPKQALLNEAGVQDQIVAVVSSSSNLATKPDYALPSGGFDLGRRLADLRAQNPALMALDPDGLEATGDELARKAELATLALIPTSIAAFIGVLAQPFRRRRLLFLRLGMLALAGGVVIALGVEVLA